MSGGGKTSTSTQQVSIPPEVMARYTSVNKTAEQAAATPFQQYSTNPNAFVAPINEQQQAGIANINKAANMGQGYYGAAAGLTGAGAGPTNVGPITGQNIGQYMNPFLSSVVSPAAQLLQQQQQAQMSGQTGQAIQQGAFGGDRAGIAAANLAGQQGLAFANAINPLLSQGYTQALGTAQQQQGFDLAQQQANQQRQLMAGAQFGQLGTGAQGAALAGAQAQLGAGALQQQTQQAGQSALYNQFLQQQAYPFQVAQFLANIAEGTGALSGSTTTGTQPAPFFSDERLKQDVRDIGRTHDGQKIVEFRYKGEGGPKRMGLLAQDVEKHHPDAVGLAGGYKTVDYDRALHDSASMGGGVHPQHAGEGFAQGGAPYLDMYGMPGQGASRLPPDVMQQAMAGKNRQLMLPQGGLKPAQTGMSQVMDAVKTEQGLKGAFNDAGSAWDSASKFYSKATASPESQNSPQDYDKPEPYDPNKAHGGLVGYASGGMPYSGEGLDIPDEENKRQLATAGNLPGQQSGLGGIKDALGAVGAIKGLASLPGSISSAAGTIGSGLSGAAEAIGGAASGIGGALGSAAEFLPFLLLKDGGAVYREHHADGESVGDQSISDAIAAGGGDSSLLDLLQSAKNQPEKVSSGLGAAGPVQGPPMNDVVQGPPMKELVQGPSPRPAGLAPSQVASRSSLEPAGAPPRTTPATGTMGAYQSMAADAAKNAGIDPKNFNLVINAESSWRPRPGDENSSGGLLQFHVGGISEKYPNSGLGDQFFQDRHPDLAQSLTPQQKVAYLNDPRNQKEILDYGANHIAKNGYGAWTTARQMGLVGGEPTRAQTSATPGQSSDTGPLSGLASAARSAGNAITGAASDTGNWFKSNQEWLVPLLTGIGTMASSPSRYLGAAMLQGLGGGAQAYAQQQKLQNEQTRLGLQALQNYQSQFQPTYGPDNKTVTGYIYKPSSTPVSVEQYNKNISDARSALMPAFRSDVFGAPGVSGGQAAPSIERAITQASTTAPLSPQPTQAPAPVTAPAVEKKYPPDERGLPSLVPGDANSYRARMDALTARASNLSPDNPNRKMLESEAAALVPEELRTRTEGARVASEAKGNRAVAYLNASQNFLTQYDQAKKLNRETAENYQTYKSGPYAERAREVGAMSGALGVGAGQREVAGYDIANKSSAADALMSNEMYGMKDAPATGAQMGLASTHHPTKAPEANYKIVTDKDASLDYNRDMAEAFKASGGRDFDSFLTEFQKTHRFEDYTARSRMQTAPFAGTSDEKLRAARVERPIAIDASTTKDKLMDGHYYTSNGRLLRWDSRAGNFIEPFKGQ